MTAFIIIIGLALDALFAEPVRHHPLVYFGHWANFIERKFNKNKAGRGIGSLGFLIVLLPIVSVAIWLEYILSSFIYLCVAALCVYSAVGWHSLIQHAQRIKEPLNKADIVSARSALAMIVSRDTKTLDEKNIVKATVESVLENGADAIFSALFWFCILGIPGVIMYRLVNTLDAMWGYKTARFLSFGWCAARVDDALNYIPARLTALSYALVGNRSQALKAWRTQAHTWKSPNAGPVMASGAGALNISLGGAAMYHGVEQDRPILGPVESSVSCVNVESVSAAIMLIQRALLLWVSVIILANVLFFVVIA